MSKKGTKRVCAKGHVYYKSSSCPTCPVCESTRKPSVDFFAALSAPARRALEAAQITSLKKLSNYSEEDLLKLHGLGKTSLPKLAVALHKVGLDFKKKSA